MPLKHRAVVKTMDDCGRLVIKVWPHKTFVGGVWARRIDPVPPARPKVSSHEERTRVRVCVPVCVGLNECDDEQT